MTGREADEVARYWYGYALSMAKGRPPLYSQEDWQAEALVGLAKAVSDLPSGAPMPLQAVYVKRAVSTHLAKARRNVNNGPTADSGPRVTYATAKRLDEPQNLGGGEIGTRHDVVGDPASPDPWRSFTEATLRADLREFAATLGASHRQAFGFLLRSLEPAEVARITGRTETAESNLRLRVRRKLRTALEARGYGA